MNCAFDTNVLVYTLAPSSDPRRSIARDLIILGMQGGSAFLPLQTLAEFSSTATRKFGIDADTVLRRVNVWREVFSVEPAAQIDIVAALETMRDHKLGFWDALLCATASRAGARYLLTEDLQDGRSFGAMTIVNPFFPSNRPLVERILAR